ncbi:MAG: hypothetical protein GQ546_00790 [Gammaproteobacteria bacterium]|nr:hypothetical protein [Gammaproteobacteria bacterium]
MKKRILLFSFVLVLCVELHAYETQTHELVTESALKSSLLLKNDDFLSDVGLTRPLDVKDTDSNTNEDGEVNNNIVEMFPDPKNIQRNIIGLVRYGSSYEDRHVIPWACSHFFDPAIDGRPLTPCSQWPASSFQNRSPDWALEDGSIDISNREDSLMKDAQERYRYALTSRYISDRDFFFGAFFRNLGQAIHHIQDMSQPQHVRNDAHLPFIDASLYEGYSKNKYHVKETTFGPNLDEDIKSQTIPIGYDELSLRDFHTARSFWTNAGKGIAEFTNRNFVSQDTNFTLNVLQTFPNHLVIIRQALEYEQPDPTYSIVESVNIEDPSLLGPDQPYRGEMLFVGTDIIDENTGIPEFNNRTSTFSIFSADLEYYAISGINQRAFTLNRFNFDKAHEFLLPRAVSYSAGLINYFFRGRMAVKNVQYLAGNQISLTVKNITGEKNPGNAPFSFTDGDFILSYDDSDGNRYSLAPHPINTVFNDEDEISLLFTLPAAMDAIDTARPFTLIFDGKIGAPDNDPAQWERGIAAKVFYSSPLMAFNIEGLEAGALVPNVINTYRSFDQGVSWGTAGAFYVIVDDDTVDDPGNQVRIQNAVYGGAGLLLYVSYTDYDSSLGIRKLNYTALTTDIGQSWSGWLTDFNYLSDGTKNSADNKSVLGSISYTGEQGSLSAIRVKHPSAGDPPPAVRTFQLVTSPQWGNPDTWELSGHAIPGGLPELDYLGNDSYAFSVYIEASESSEPQARAFDSALRRTDDGGTSYYDLSNFAIECVPEDEFCIQHLLYLGQNDNGNKRLLGWANRHVFSYNHSKPSNQVPVYLSEDGGQSWIALSTAPLSSECRAVEKRHVTVDKMIYMGSHNEKNMEQYSLFLETSCYEVIEDINGDYENHTLIGQSYFTSNNSGGHWTQVSAPPGPESMIVYAADNGAIPGLYD